MNTEQQERTETNATWIEENDPLLGTAKEEYLKQMRRSSFGNGMLAGIGCALGVVGIICLIMCLVQFGRQNTIQSETETVQNSENDSSAQNDENDSSVQNNGNQLSSTEVYSSSMVDVYLLEKIKLIEALIKERYYRNEDIDEEKMEAGIYSGMINALGDIYSEYYTPQELEEMLQEAEGIYYGIGAGVTMDTVYAYPKISKVYSGTPSEEAGLRENDIICEVNGEDVYGLSLSEVVSRIRGEEGTWVNMTIYREGESAYLSIDARRGKVNIPTVEFKMLEDHIAYILISEFDTVTIDQFAEALAMARGNQMQGLILDLRSNPGGSVVSVVEIARKILPEGLIVYTENKYGRREEYTCDGTRALEVPLVVLINGNSASSAEILAGAIKDHGSGTLVGTTTYGKGIVQSLIPLSDGSAVKLTISSYFSPQGNNIHGIGVEPDEECVFDAAAYYGDPSRPDNQLDKAVEVLKELMAKQEQ